MGGGMRSRSRVAALILSIGLVMVAMLSLIGCTSKTTTTASASTEPTQQATTSSLSTSTTSPPSKSTWLPADVRVGVMIPADILYKGRIYAGGGQVVRVASNTPADLSVVGSGPAADVTGAPIPDSQYAIYAIKGIDQNEAIAVKFQGRSSSGPIWVWLKYERKT